MENNNDDIKDIVNVIRETETHTHTYSKHRDSSNRLQLFPKKDRSEKANEKAQAQNNNGTRDDDDDNIVKMVCVVRVVIVIV